MTVSETSVANPAECEGRTVKLGHVSPPLPSMPYRNVQLGYLFAILLSAVVSAGESVIDVAEHISLRDKDSTSVGKSVLQMSLRHLAVVENRTATRQQILQLRLENKIFN